MRKQLDPRIPILINNNVKLNHRSFIVLVGDKGRDQVRALKDIGMSFWLMKREDCEPSLSAVAGASFCSAVGAVVLQEGPRVHDVRSPRTPPLSSTDLTAVTERSARQRSNVK